MKLPFLRRSVRFLPPAPQWVDWSFPLAYHDVDALKTVLIAARYHSCVAPSSFHCRALGSPICGQRISARIHMPVASLTNLHRSQEP
jgi:hypothetical protein